MRETFNVPSAPNIERAVLGAILMSDGQLLSEVAAVLEADEFFLDSHRVIFRRMLQMSGLIDLLTVSEALEGAGELGSIGGIEYLTTLTEGQPKITSAAKYVEIVKSKAGLRRLAEIGTWTQATALAEEEDAETVAAEAQRRMLDLTTGNGGASGFTTIGEIVAKIAPALEGQPEALAKASGIKTGFRRLDAMTGGLHRGEMVILAARPGLGKTSLATNVAVNVARKAPGTVAVFSLEMSKDSLVIRMACTEAGLSQALVRKETATPEQRRQLCQSAARLVELPIEIEDTSALRPETMLARAKALKLRRGELSLIVIDYLQLIGAPRGNNRNRYEEISQVSRLIKQMAKELNAPVLAISQFSRAPEERGGCPRLSDLRESGQLEQDADMVLFLWNGDPNGPDNLHPSRRAGNTAQLTRTSGEAIPVNLTIGKQRNGPTGNVELVFHAETTRFEEAHV